MARPSLPDDLPDDVLRFGSISQVGAIERIMTEWQDNALDLSVEQIIDYLTGMLIAAGKLPGQVARSPAESG